MSQQQRLKNSPKASATLILGAFLLAFVTGVHVPDKYKHLYFGGMVCETTNGIKGCVGYPPTGIIVAVIMYAAVLSGMVVTVDLARGVVE